MRLGTKILLLMLVITVGSSAVVSWMVTMNVTQFETARPTMKSPARSVHYVNHLDDRYQQISRVVRAMLEARAAVASAGSRGPGRQGRAGAAKEEVLGRDVQTDVITRRLTGVSHTCQSGRRGPCGSRI